MYKIKFYKIIVLSCLLQLFSTANLEAQVITSEKGKAMLEQLLESSERTTQEKPDSAVYYARQAIQQATELNATDELAAGNQLLGLAYQALKQFDKAHVHFDKAIKLYKKVDNKSGIANTQYHKAKAYSHSTDFPEAIKYFRIALNYATESKDTVLMAPVLLNYGIVYARRGEYYAGLQYFIKSLDAYNALGDETYITAISNNIGNIYREMGEFEKALEYFKALENIIEGDDTKRKEQVALFINMGLTYAELKHFEEALNCYEKTLNLSALFKIDDVQGLIFNNIGAVYEEQGRYKESLEMYEKAIPFRKRNNNRDGLAKTLNGISDVAYALGNYQMALEKKQEALRINKAINDKEGISECYRELAYTYDKLGNRAKAFDYLDKHLELQDSIFEKNKLEEVFRLESEYKYKEEQLLVESEVEILRRDKSLQQSRQTILILSLASLLLVLIAVFWIFYQNKKKTNLLEKDLENKVIIEKQSQALEEASQAKSRFFTNTAHELRTPLTLIAGAINNVLKRYKINKKIREELEVAQRNTGQLTQLVNQILDLSKNDFQELNAEISMFKFIDLYNFLVKEFSSYAAYQKIDFQSNNFLSDELELTTDGGKLFIILKNILSNAFKFTSSHGGIRFQCFEKEHQVEIIVTDTGQGIHADDLPHIFDRYFQTKQAAPKLEGGTGIGLATSKEYINLLGGDIKVESELGRGSTFRIIFPKQLSTEVSNVPAYPLPFIEHKMNIISPPLSTIYNPNVVNNILVVEDNLDICRYLQSILQDEYNIVYTHNGKEAISYLVREQPNLIITDLMMPVMDGFEFLEHLKKDKVLRNIPVITLTARGSASDRLRALTIGIDDYLTKPFEETELKARIRNLLINLENRLDYKSELEEERLSSPTPIDENAAIVKVSNENNFSKEDLDWLERLQNETIAGICNIDFNANHLSEAMALSKSQLYRRVKLLTGLTLKSYMQQVRFHQARKLLENKTFSTVKAVSYSVGFKDEKYFARKFKERFGKNPSEYL